MMKPDYQRLAVRALVWTKRGLWVVAGLAAGFVVLSFFVVLGLRWLNPPVSGIQLQRQLEAASSEQTFAPKHHWVPYSEISPAIRRAVIAAEDQRFYQHFGFDFDQLSKAIAEHRRGGRLRGASTITQQTAKNLFLWNGRSYLRKALEAWFTLLMELLWPKERILTVYLNIEEFGAGVFGVEAASQHHFNRPASRLNRYQAALLAAVLPNPHRMSASQPSAYVRQRQQWILQHMAYLPQ